MKNLEVKDKKQAKDRETFEKEVILNENTQRVKMNKRHQSSINVFDSFKGANDRPRGFQPGLKPLAKNSSVNSSVNSLSK